MNAQYVKVNYLNLDTITGIYKGVKSEVGNTAGESRLGRRIKEKGGKINLPFNFLHKSPPDYEPFAHPLWYQRCKKQ